MVCVVKSQGFVLYVNLNMLVCSVVFVAWARPRETISGLVGRWKVEETGRKQRFARRASKVIDALYWWEENHCVEVARQEREARKALYP